MLRNRFQSQLLLPWSNPSGSLLQCPPSRSSRNFFSTSFRLQQYGPKTYFQPGDNHIALLNTPVQQAQYGNGGYSWRAVLLFSLASSLATSSLYYYKWLSPPSAQLTSDSLPNPPRAAPSTPHPAESDDFLTVQSALHDSNGSHFKEILNKVMISSALGGTAIYFYDTVRDEKIFKERPLRLANGTLVTNENAAFIRCYDIHGELHSAILAIDDVEQSIPARLDRGSWMDNTTPTQKWMIEFELDLRRKATTAEDPLGSNAGITLIYLTKDVIGIGAFGLAGKDHSPNPKRPETVMMQCVQNDTITVKRHLKWMKEIATNRKPIPERQKPRKEKKVNINVVLQPDGSKILQLVLPGGGLKEVGRITGEFRQRHAIEKEIAFFQTDEDGNVVRRIEEASFSVIMDMNEQRDRTHVLLKLPGGKVLSLAEIKGDWKQGDRAGEIVYMDDVDEKGQRREVFQLRREEVEKYGLEEDDERMKLKNE